jgi:DNA-binding NtrC family response regulator
VGIQTSSILIVDRKDAAHTFLASCLPDYYECVPARSAVAAIEMLRQRPFDLVITDITMLNPSGVELCVFIHRTFPDSILVAMSGIGGVQYEIEAMRQGAFEYIEEPFDSAEVCASVEHALRHKALFNRPSSSGTPTKDANPILEGAYEADGIESAPSFLRM